MSHDESLRWAASSAVEMSVVCMALALHRGGAEILYELPNHGGNGCAVDAERRMRGAPWASADRRQHGSEPHGNHFRNGDLVDGHPARRAGRDRDRHEER